jgi:AraC-like DNA-binding protein
MQKYIYLPVASPLQEYVISIWEVLGEQNIHETILPQGVIEIVFNFAESIQGILPYSHTVTSAPRCFIQGIHTHVVNAVYLGQHHLLGIRLQPHRIHDLLGILPAELKNTHIDLTLIKPAFNHIWHQLMEVPSFQHKVHILLRELPSLTPPACQRSNRLSYLFFSDNVESFQSVDELARQVCYSSRQLNRVVHQLFGFSAEEITVYKKYVQAVTLMQAGSSSLTEIAYQAGFYDQAHFCRVFKSYSGMTPKQYSTRKSELPFHIII